MNVALRIQLGRRGPVRALKPIWLDVSSVGAASSWSGSYHVLAMGRHYDDYSITGRIIGLPPIAGIPVAHPYERLTGKIRAAGGTGNIGEEHSEGGNPLIAVRTGLGRTTGEPDRIACERSELRDAGFVFWSAAPLGEAANQRSTA